MPLRFIVTRPAASAQGWLSALADAGLCVQSLPLIDIVPEPLQGALGNARVQLDRWPIWMFVSPNSFRCFARDLPVPLSVGNSRAWAPGPGTAAAVAAAGWPPDQIDSPDLRAVNYDSEALWQKVRDQVAPGRIVCIVRGGDASGRVVGRMWLRDRVLAAGGQVRQLLSYRRLPVTPDADGLLHLRRVATTSTTVWLFSSAFAFRSLQQLLPGFPWAGSRAIATHGRIAQVLQQAGFADVRVVRPVLSELLDVARSMS